MSRHDVTGNTQQTNKQGTLQDPGERGSYKGKVLEMLAVGAGQPSGTCVQDLHLSPYSQSYRAPYLRPRRGSVSFACALVLRINGNPT